MNFTKHIILGCLPIMRFIIVNWICSVGQGASGQSVFESKPTTFKQCIEECNQKDECATFDYSYKVLSCRMYSTKKEISSDPGGDLRIYCTGKNSGNNVNRLWNLL